MAHEGEEGGDTECFVAVADDLQGDGIVVEEDTEPGDEGVDGDHPENANDTVTKEDPVSEPRVGERGTADWGLGGRTHWRCSIGLL